MKVQSKNIQNSKYKNPGVLFELLIRQVSSDALSGKIDSPAIDLVKKYFSPSTELGKEVQLYRAFFETRKLTETTAIHFIDLIIERRKTLDDRKLAVEKYNLVKEIKTCYPLKDFLSTKLSNYRTYASIYKTFCTETATDDTRISNISDVALARFSLIEYLVNGNKKVESNVEHLKEFVSQDYNVRQIAQKIFIDKFNQKYNSLNEKQKALLREYIVHSANPHLLFTYLQKDIPELQHALQRQSSKINNKVLQIKINEVAAQLNHIIKQKAIKDNHITAMLMAYQILSEIEHG
jgi:hypothetical protein